MGAVGVGDSDEESAVRGEEWVEIEEGLTGVKKVFEAVPEGDAVEGGELLGVADRGDDGDFGVAETVEIEFGAVDVPAASAGGDEEAAVSAADIEDLAGGICLD